MQMSIAARALIIAALALPPSAGASLVEIPLFTPFFREQMLTLQTPSNSATATGSVGLTAGGVQVTSGDVVGITRVRAVAGGFATVLLNVGSNGPTADAITVNDLVLNIYSPNGSLLFTSGAFVPVTIPVSFNPFLGFFATEFQLDWAQFGDAVAAGAFSVPENLAGLSASVTNVPGSTEIFYLLTPDPEPETYLMLLAGVGLLALHRKSQRRNKTTKVD